MFAGPYLTGPKPPVFISERDLSRLEQLVAAYERRENVTAEFLANELERAEVRPAEQIPGDVVTMSAWVAFRLEPAGTRQQRTLVYPDAYAAASQREGYVSVLTPVGAALIGLRVGSRLDYPASKGQWLSLVIEAVEQPAAAIADTGPVMVADNVVAFPVGRPARHKPQGTDEPGPDAA
jgi:regulator of nucleoside diphosphate kinase